MSWIKEARCRDGQPPWAMLQHPLAREVVLVVTVKTFLVLAAGLLLFGPAQRPRLTAGSVEDRVLVQAGLTQSGRSAP